MLESSTREENFLQEYESRGMNQSMEETAVRKAFPSFALLFALRLWFQKKIGWGNCLGGGILRQQDNDLTKEKCTWQLAQQTDKV